MTLKCNPAELRWKKQQIWRNRRAYLLVAELRNTVCINWSTVSPHSFISGQNAKKRQIEVLMSIAANDVLPSFISSSRESINYIHSKSTGTSRQYAPIVIIPPKEQPLESSSEGMFEKTMTIQDTDEDSSRANLEPSKTRGMGYFKSRMERMITSEEEVVPPTPKKASLFTICMRSIFFIYFVNTFLDPLRGRTCATWTYTRGLVFILQYEIFKS